MKRVIISLLFLLSITVLFFPSCDYTKLSNHNEKKADIKQDTTMLDEAVENPEDDGIGDEENLPDEEYWNDDDYGDPETKRIEGLYTDLLPGKWFCKIASEDLSEYVEGNKLSSTLNVSETLVINPDYNYYQKIFMRIVLHHQPVELDDHSGFGPSIYYGGATIDITGESNGTWYVDNSNLVQNISSWKITPAYHHEHGETRNGHYSADDKVIQEYAPVVKEMMDAMKRSYSKGVIYRNIKDLNGNSMVLNVNGQTKTYKKQ